MPIYEYECGACGHNLEALQKMSDMPLRECPDCGESTLRRLVSAPAFRLKGSGWYETDFKTGDNKRNLAGDKAEAEAKAKAKADKDTADTATKKDGEKKGGKTTAGDGKSDTKASAGNT